MSKFAALSANDLCLLFTYYADLPRRTSHRAKVVSIGAA